ncbi:putative nitrogen regulatory protein [Clavispora lusitaniae]|uniref:GATA-type domain-containing protein n=3 Tax=Clavispora lusitaniae TaxID=36911 RepID=C4Y0X6_CLAL4|nr:uncharacterized protein CLUG_01858 [Clavispora lusitaniae ATCC 42720]KAF5211927.1 hypothetical protein E0198_001473 [Clavispora lusitaniae]EEQ37735.1 hypothetical protein CLUG_01858 [Clavispora lusitaniae ATCC 42720]KAF7583314.1 GATA zinc finger family protein [Clavispora lusitaniae]OVF10611.1 putative transcription factor [Clavispora lusitaniae]QFZ26731.1 putative nitrogen regulatory protein [Clavispora lusitaniae]
MTSATANDAHAALSSGPSIMELFTQAKRLLALQPRVENRQLRKENSRHQRRRSISPSSPSDAKVLDLLSPLSMDDLRGSVTDAKRKPTPKKTPQNDGITPVSMNDSPPEAVRVQRAAADTLGAAPVKKEPCEGVTPVSVHAVKSEPSRSQLTASLRDNDSSSNMEIDPKSPVRGVKPPTECFNCHTLKTPLWRKDRVGNTLCNACGLFLKLHGTTRPLSLKTDVIRKRSSRRVSITPARTAPGSSPASHDGRTPIPNGIPIMGSAPRSVSSVGSFSSYGSAPHQMPTEGARQKNVLILPKPPSSSALASAPSSPYNTTSQFKRKKSEVGEDMLRRTPSMLAGKPVVKRGFSSTSVNRRTSVTNLPGSFHKMRFAPTSGTYFDQPQPESPYSPSSLGPTSARSSFAAPEGSLGSMGGRLNSMTGVSLSMDPLIDPLSAPLGTSLNGPYGGSLTEAPNDSLSGSLCDPLTASDSLPEFTPYVSSVKNEDIDADDFFKNYTSLHNDDSIDVDPADLATPRIDNVGGRYEIKPSATKSTLTDGLKARAYNDTNDTKGGDLDWLKFEI